MVKNMKKLTRSRLIFYPLFLFILTVFFGDRFVAALSSNNGFDLSDSLIDINEIHHGGPAKDGIPAIDHPNFIPSNQANYLSNDDRVLGLAINGIAKAFPIKILNYHEIVNDYLGKQAVVITYCPLCGSGVSYSANIGGENTTFGVSGLLYNSDVLLYDRESGSLWSQLLSKSISGKHKGTDLEMLALNHTSWQAWKLEHPETLVLSNKTGFSRDYTKTPYGNYDNSQSLYFPVNKLNTEYHPKEYAIGLKINGKTKVYPFAELSKIKSPYKDHFQEQDLIILFDAQNRTGKILDSNGNEIPSVTSFWFAWMAFYPKSSTFRVNVQR